MQLALESIVILDTHRTELSPKRNMTGKKTLYDLLHISSKQLSDLR